jgi:hypothetical protein
MDPHAALMSSPLLQELEAINRGEKQLVDSAAKRHHLVAEFLLRHFTVVRDGRERLVQLDVRTGTPRWVDPRDAASRHRFYRVAGEAGVQHQKIEAFLAVVESHAAPALQRLLDHPERLDRADRATLSLFFALLQGRTLGGVARVTEFADTAMKLMFAGHLADAETFSWEYREVIGDADDETIERQRQWILHALADDRVQPSDSKAMALDLLLNAVGDSFQIVYQLHWYVVELEGRAFVTSDCGLSMYDPTPRFPWSGNGWVGSPNSQTAIPLDSRRCMLVTPGRHGPTERLDQRRAAKPEVDAVNLRTYGFASQYIFSHSQQVATDLRALAKRRPDDVVRPQPNPAVMLIKAEEGDDRLADEHRRRGWPPRLMVRGEPHDYAVMTSDGGTVEKSVDMAVLAKTRAMRELGDADLDGPH